MAATTASGYDTTYQFSVGPDQTSANQYDFAVVDQSTAQTGAISSMPTGPLVRTTQTTYLTGDSNYRGRNILGLPVSTTVYNADGSMVAQGTVSYDENSLLTYGSVTGWTDPQTTYRGNPTTTSRWLDLPTPTWSAAHAQYDQCGSVRYAWDAKGNQSQVEYSSTNNYAYPTLTRTVAPDPSGQYGSSTAFVGTTVFDFNTGLVSSTTDANQIVSTPEYNDPLMRPTRAVHASGNSAQTQSLMQYDDLNRIVTGKSDLNSFNDSTLKAKTLADGIGRTIETRTYESDTNYIAVQTQYDALGRAYKVSNPFRPWQSETPVWTTSAFDALGRVVSVTTPDGAVITTSYLGNAVTVTDQAGKKRRSVSDALGRVIRVDEPDANGNLDDQNVQSTNYLYDALGNLRQVTQGAQQRFFMYDSLSRLIRARNLEQDTNASLNLTDSTTGNSSWCVAYSYDANGNLISKTDARNITMTFAYDALNRVISKSYNDSPQTATVNYFYDTASLPSGAPSFDRGYANGRLVAVTYGGGSAGTYRGYDALGRVVRQYQQTDSVNYLVEANYNPAGMMTSETYPSVPGASDRRTVTYMPDAAGRLSSLSTSATSYAPAASVSNIDYASSNALNTETYGNGLIQAITYNNRLQPTDIKLGTSSNSTSILDLSYSYGTTNNNGNVLAVNYSGGGLYYTQSFSYDQLNRLSTATELSGPTQNWSQTNGYDRYGNRWIVTSGGGGGSGTPGAGSVTISGSEQSTTVQGDDECVEYYLEGGCAQWRPTYYTQYDSGTVSITVNGVTASAYYGYGSTDVSVATALTSAINNNQSMPVTASRSGATISLTAKTTGANTNYSLSASSTTDYPQYFSPSFTATSSGPNLTGGSDGGGGGSQNLTFSTSTNRITTSGYVYDFAGNLTNDTIHSYSFDAENKIVKVDGNSAFVYDGAGQRVKKLVGENARFVYGIGGQLIAEFDGSTGNLKKEYVSGGATLITIEPTAVNYNGTQYAALDHLGSPRVMTNSGGSVASRHDYLPFGEELPAGIGGRTTAMGFSNAGDTNRKKFTGYEADAETGLNFAQARYQSPVQGRFTSVDPLGRSANVLNPQSFNRYSYVNNNPVNSVDPSGLALIDVNSAEEQHDKSVQEAIGLKAFNDAFNRGDMNAARSILTANPSIGYEENSSYNPNAEGNVTASAEITGVAGEPQDSGSTGVAAVAQEHEGAPTGPFVVTDPIRYANEPLIGDGDCVALVRAAAPDLSSTKLWRPGENVFGNGSIKEGTVIATFVGDRYPNKPHGNHAAIYLGQDKGGIWVVDQFLYGRGGVKMTNSQRRYIQVKEWGTDPSNNARAFSVVMAAVPNPRPRK